MVKSIKGHISQVLDKVWISFGLSNEELNEVCFKTPWWLYGFKRYGDRLVGVLFAQGADLNDGWKERADIVSAMMFGAKNPAEAARLVGSSYEPAHRVFRDFERAGVKITGSFDASTIVGDCL